MTVTTAPASSSCWVLRTPTSPAPITRTGAPSSLKARGRALVGNDVSDAERPKVKGRHVTHHDDRRRAHIEGTEGAQFGAGRSLLAGPRPFDDRHLRGGVEPTIDALN